MKSLTEYNLNNIVDIEEAVKEFPLRIVLTPSNYRKDPKNWINAVKKYPYVLSSPEAVVVRENTELQNIAKDADEFSIYALPKDVRVDQSITPFGAKLVENMLDNELFERKRKQEYTEQIEKLSKREQQQIDDDLSSMLESYNEDDTNRTVKKHSNGPLPAQKSMEVFEELTDFISNNVSETSYKLKGKTTNDFVEKDEGKRLEKQILSQSQGITSNTQN